MLAPPKEATPSEKRIHIKSLNRLIWVMETERGAACRHAAATLIAMISLGIKKASGDDSRDLKTGIAVNVVIDPSGVGGAKYSVPSSTEAPSAALPPGAAALVEATAMEATALSAASGAREARDESGAISPDLIGEDLIAALGEVAAPGGEGAIANEGAIASEGAPLRGEASPLENSTDSNNDGDPSGVDGF